MIAVIFSSELSGLDVDPYAALKKQYLEDAKNYSGNPWELWQFKGEISAGWIDCRRCPEWSPHTEYRRKKHADLMIQYQKDAKNYLGAPWELWQFKHIHDSTNDWRDCTNTPSWVYRRRKHADLMLQYGKEIGDNPWLNWEHKVEGYGTFVNCSARPYWDETTEYRRRAGAPNHTYAFPGIWVGLAEQTQPTGHPHAALMIQYGEESKTDPAVWKKWQHKFKTEWRDCSGTPVWSPNVQYRRKPEVILINGIEVPKPLTKAPEVGQPYSIVALTSKGHVHQGTWMDYQDDRKLLKLGLVHSTKENAEAHAHALLSFTKTV